MAGAAPHDLPRQPPGPPLVAVVGEDPLQGRLASPSFSRSAAVASAAPIRMSSGAPGRKVNPRSASSNCREETPRSSRMKSGRKAVTAASAAGWRTGPRGTRSAVAQPRPGRGDRVGIPVDAEHLEPASRRAAAWPPCPRVASTARAAARRRPQHRGRAGRVREAQGWSRTWRILVPGNATPRPGRTG